MTVQRVRRLGQRHAARGRVDGLDAGQQPRLGSRVGLGAPDLDPVAGAQRPGVAPVGADEQRPRTGVHALDLDAERPRALLARPAVAVAPVHLDPVQMVARRSRRRRRASREEPAAAHVRRHQLAPLSQRGRGRGGLAVDRQPPRLRDDLGARGGVGSTEGGLAQARVLRRRHETLPGVEVEEIGPSGAAIHGQHRARQERLRRQRRQRLVLAQQAADVEAPGADQQVLELQGGPGRWLSAAEDRVVRVPRAVEHDVVASAVEAPVAQQLPRIAGARTAGRPVAKRDLAAAAVEAPVRAAAGLREADEEQRTGAAPARRL